MSSVAAQLLSRCSNSAAKEYVRRKEWKSATALECAYHPDGSYGRVSPQGLRVKRFLCPDSGRAVSRLQVVRAARLTGTLPQVERAVEQAGDQPPKWRKLHPARYLCGWARRCVMWRVLEHPTSLLTPTHEHLRLSCFVALYPCLGSSDSADGSLPDPVARCQCGLRRCGRASRRSPREARRIRSEGHGSGLPSSPTLSGTQGKDANRPVGPKRAVRACAVPVARPAVQGRGDVRHHMSSGFQRGAAESSSRPCLRRSVRAA